MENELDKLLDGMKEQRDKNRQFYDQHEDEQYGWKDYVKFKNWETHQSGKLMKQKEKNLVEQTTTV